jgi:phage tail-like protein
MATGQRKDPFSAFNFQVQIDGVTVAGFSECSGLVAETEIIDYRNGDEDITRRRLPGLKKFNNLVFKRGFTNSKELWTWRKTVMDGKTQRQAGSIVLLDEARQPALRWNFSEGWPAKLEGPTLNAGTNANAIETLEIGHEGLEMVV